jgi:hypothetical protein
MQMRTLTDATLFTVNGPRGCYYAVRSHDTGTVLTERTESAAAALANEKDLLIVEQREISHAELLEMMAARAEEGGVATQGSPTDHPASAGEHRPGLLGFARRILHHEPQPPTHFDVR